MALWLPGKQADLVAHLVHYLPSDDVGFGPQYGGYPHRHAEADPDITYPSET